MNPYRKIALATLVAPLVFGLAACGDAAGTASGEIAEGEAIAPIEAPEGTQWIDQVVRTEADGYMLGNPDAPIKLIEYGSLTCGACANFAMTGAEPLKQEYVNSGRVSFELRNQIHNGIDLILARMVRCGAPESFHPLSDQVWLNLQTLLQGTQANPGALEQAMNLPEDQRFVAAAQAAGLYEFFASRGISVDQAQTCLADFDSVQQIAENSRTQSDELNVTGTPTFIVNGVNVGTHNWASLEPILQRAGAR